jgi:tricarballylate dehydrogenase
MQPWDVIIVGASNAALCAALSAQESGAKVLVLEKAAEEESGGNSRFTAGLMRIRCDPDLTEILIKQSYPTVVWMREKGVRFTAAWESRAFPG